MTGSRWRVVKVREAVRFVVAAREAALTLRGWYPFLGRSAGSIAMRIRALDEGLRRSVLGSSPPSRLAAR